MHIYVFLIVLLLLPLETFASWSEHQGHFHQDHSQQELHHKDIPQFTHPEQIRSKHVYALANLLKEETESIRYIMGVAKIDHALFQVKNAAPREVYFQAVNLYGKTSRLYHNLTAHSISDHDLPALQKNIQPADVWAVLSVVLTQLNEIKEEYGITSHPTFPHIEESKTPTDVYQSLLLIIRQINQMLQEEPYTHSDVYQETSTALYCLLNIYNTFPGLQVQRQPELRPGRQDKDVFLKLVRTYQTVQNILMTSGIKVLDLAEIQVLDLSEVPSPNIKPGDIYDLAVLVTSELKFLHSKAAPEQIAHRAPYPGIKFPSHVLQRLTFLHNHLQVILTEVKMNPHWLNEQ